MKNWIYPLVTLILLTLILELLLHFQILDTYLFASPTQILSTLWLDRAEYWESFQFSALAALKGFLLSGAIGFLLATLLDLNLCLKKSFYPFASFFQTVPIIAIAPMMVIWFGFGAPTVIACSFICSLFPVIANTMMGFENVPRSYLDLFKIYKANTWKIFWNLKLPFSMPSIFSGLKISAGLSVIGAIVGEFVGGGGLGAIVDSARTQQRIDKVFAAVFLICMLGVFFISVIEYLQKITLQKLNLLK